MADSTKEQPCGCSSADPKWVVTTEMLLAYEATRGAAGVPPEDRVRRAVDLVDSGKPAGEWCTPDELDDIVQRAPNDENQLVTAGYKLRAPPSTPHLEMGGMSQPPASDMEDDGASTTGTVIIHQLSPVASSPVPSSPVLSSSVTASSDAVTSLSAAVASSSVAASPVQVGVDGQEVTPHVSRVPSFPSSLLENRKISSKEILAAVPKYKDNGYISDDVEDPAPAVDISPCMFAFFAEGCKRWDDDPEKPVTPEVPENNELVVSDPGPSSGPSSGPRDKDNINGRGHDAITKQVDDETATVLSGEYDVSEFPTLVRCPPGVNSNRHVESGIDLTIFDRMFSDGRVARAVADLRKGKTAGVEDMPSTSELESYTAHDIAYALETASKPIQGIQAREVASHLKVYVRATVNAKAKEKKSTANLETHLKAIDGVLERKKVAIDLMENDAATKAKKEKAERIREHIANRIRDVDAEYASAYAAMQSAKSREEEAKEQFYAEKAELYRICHEYGFDTDTTVRQVLGGEKPPDDEDDYFLY